MRAILSAFGRGILGSLREGYDAPPPTLKSFAEGAVKVVINLAGLGVLFLIWGIWGILTEPPLFCYSIATVLGPLNVACIQ